MSNEKLKQIVERIERLEEEKQEVAYAIKDIYDEAKAVGFETKPIKEIIKLRKKPEAFRELQEMVELYMAALNGTQQ